MNVDSHRNGERSAKSKLLQRDCGKLRVSRRRGQADKADKRRGRKRRSQAPPSEPGYCIGQPVIDVL